MPKKPTKDEGRWYPDLDDQPVASNDGTPWYPEVRETGLEPVPDEYAAFPWPKGYAVNVTKKMGR